VYFTNKVDEKNKELFHRKKEEEEKKAMVTDAVLKNRSIYRIRFFSGRIID
jgi:hypothetical protein